MALVVISWWCWWWRRHVTVIPAAVVALRFALLFHLELLAQDGGDFALHERPRYRRVGQGTLFAARAVHLGTGALSLDALAATGEAELVVSHRGALHKVGIFEPFLAQGTLERGVRSGRRCRSSGPTTRHLLLLRSGDSGSGWALSWSTSLGRTTSTSGRSHRSDGTRGQTADDLVLALTGSAARLRSGLRWLG